MVSQMSIMVSMVNVTQLLQNKITIFIFDHNKIKFQVKWLSCYASTQQEAWIGMEDNPPFLNSCLLADAIMQIEISCNPKGFFILVTYCIFIR